MVLGSLDQLDLVAGPERHHCLLPARPAPFVLAHALPLALARGRPHVGNLDVEDLLDSLTDLDLVGVEGHLEGDGVQLFFLLHALVVLARGGAERLAAALPLGRPDRALAGAARALLLPRLPAAARHLAPPLGVVRARAPRGQLLHHGLVDQRHAHRLREDVGPEIERLLLLALAVEHGNGRHATWPLCLSAAAPWSASRSCAPSRASRYDRGRRPG